MEDYYTLVKSLLLALLVVLSAFVAVPLALLTAANGAGRFEVGWLKLLGLAPMVLGAAVAFWTVMYFAEVGEGTPAPFDPPKKFVSGGLFRYVRNPMYLGAVSVLFGEAVLLESFLILGFALAMLCFFHLFVVYYEEPRLKQRFGWAYEEYLCSVPRWLPRLKRNDASVQAQRL